ncbi:MAG: beta-ketoacyl synthase N-terminal-like domain-containing protein [Myxococcota bacterium]
MPFAPIAIVGRACLLPGAKTPADLYRIAHDGEDRIGTTPEGRWRVPEAHVLSTEPRRDHAWTQRGGYVEGHEFDPAGYALPQDLLASSSSLTQWVLDVARRALVDAGVEEDHATRTGAVFGNLSLPTPEQSRFAESVWLGELAGRLGLADARPEHCFESGLPALVLAKSLGLGAGAFALDAACASSLYAIELACRALQSGTSDRMLAGAVNRADDLFLHVGFCALDAMSKTGQSRPFHAGADGLIPGEGCGFVVLERLEDALRLGHTVHGVIRGVGLANDGRGAGILAPSELGQARSMRLALEQAELSPKDVGYIECHATGTPVGDAVELASLRAVYGGDLPIGSLKGNIGHLITAAGISGLLKVLEALREETVLPTMHLDAPSDSLLASSFDVPTAPAPWRGPRRAGLSAFGFGGNDAHLIVEAPGVEKTTIQVPAIAREAVVVGLGARVGSGQSVPDFARALAGTPLVRASQVRIPLSKLRFPPNDLKKASGQQTMLLAAALEATAGLSLPKERTGVFVGYQGDPDTARWGARWRTRSWADALGKGNEWATAASDAFADPLEAAHVIGVLPNVPANRLSSQLDLGGPSYTTSAEEQSGLVALEIARASIGRGELDAAIVGAVDLASAVQDRASGQPGADAAVVLVLMSAELAEAAGCSALASFVEDGAPFDTGLAPARAAAGLVEVAGAIVVGADEIPLRVEVSAAHAASRTVAVCPHARSFPSPSAELASEEPALELPVRAPDVRLPEISMTQKMAPAPSLPPVGTEVKVPARPAATSGTCGHKEKEKGKLRWGS